MKVLLNSNLLPIINVGMYSSFLSPENMFDSYSIDDDFENGYINFNSEYFWNKFDNNLYKDKIQSLASSFLDGVLEGMEGVKINVKCGQIYSPKYYNFATDNIDLNVKFNKREVMQVARKNKDAFNSFLRKNYSSYDGFLSNTSNNYNDWLEDFKESNIQSIGAVLTFIFEDYIIDNVDGYNTFYEYVSENCFYTEFMDYSEID